MMGVKEAGSLESMNQTPFLAICAGVPLCALALLISFTAKCFSNR
jgi:hypothetical protein